MKKVNDRNSGYLLVAAVLSSTVFLFQNCSNYSATVSTSDLNSKLSGDIEQIAENSPSLNDDNVPIELDPVVPQPSDLVPGEEPAGGNQSGVIGGNQGEVNGGNNDEEEASNPPRTNPGGENTGSGNVGESSDKDDQNKHNSSLCEKIAIAGKIHKGFSVIDLSQADAGKDFSSKGKTIYVYSGSEQLELNSVSSRGKTIICGNVVVSNLIINGNCHLIHAQADNAKVNGKLTTAELEESGIDKQIDSNSGQNVKQCRVGSNLLIENLNN